MLSKNNFNEKIRQMNEKKERFSIRKLSIGAASVLLGFTFMGFNSQSAQASEVHDDYINIAKNNNSNVIRDSADSNSEKQANSNSNFSFAKNTDVKSDSNLNQKLENELTSNDVTNTNKTINNQSTDASNILNVKNEEDSKAKVEQADIQNQNKNELRKHDNVAAYSVAKTTETIASQFDPKEYSGVATFHAMDYGSNNETTNLSNFRWFGPKIYMFKNDIKSISWPSKPDLSKLQEGVEKDVTVNFTDDSSNTYKVKLNVVGFEFNKDLPDLYYGDELDITHCLTWNNIHDIVYNWGLPERTWVDKNGNPITPNSNIDGNYKELYAKVRYPDNTYQLIKMPFQLKSRKNEFVITSKIHDPIYICINRDTSDFSASASILGKYKGKEVDLLSRGIWDNFKAIIWSQAPDTTVASDQVKFAKVKVIFDGGETEEIPIPYKVVTVKGRKNLTASKYDHFQDGLTSEQVSKYIDASDLQGKFDPTYDWLKNPANTDSTWRPDHTTLNACIEVDYHDKNMLSERPVTTRQFIYVPFKLKSDADLVKDSNIKINNKAARTHYNAPYDPAVIKPAVKILDDKGEVRTDYSLVYGTINNGKFVEDTEAGTPFKTESASVSVPVVIKFDDGSYKALPVNSSKITVTIDKATAKSNVVVNSNTKLSGIIDSPNIGNYLDTANISAYKPVYEWTDINGKPNSVDTSWSDEAHKNRLAYIKVTYRNADGKSDGTQIVTVPLTIKKQADQFSKNDYVGSFISHVVTPGQEQGINPLTEKNNFTWIKKSKSGTLNDFNANIKSISWINKKPSLSVPSSDSTSYQVKVIFNDGSSSNYSVKNSKVVGYIANSTAKVINAGDALPILNSTPDSDYLVTTDVLDSYTPAVIGWAKKNKDGSFTLTDPTQVDTGVGEDLSNLYLGVQYHKAGSKTNDGIQYVKANIIAQTESDKYSALGQDIHTQVGKVPEASSAIKNKSDLPIHTDYTWLEMPDVSESGKVPAVVVVTYPDGSKDKVNVTINVDQTDVEKYAPETQPIEVKIGESPKAADGISNKSDLPADSKYTWKSPVDTTTSGDKFGTIVVTYPDHTNDEVMTVVHVDQTDAEKYAPEAQMIEVKIGESPKAENGISNKSDLPADSRYTWKSSVNTTTSGDKLGTIVVNYPDGTKDEVTTTVRVDQTEAEKYALEAQPIEVKIGEEPKAKDGISNKSDLPADSKYTWKSSVDTTTSGDKVGTIVVNYPDGTKDEVTTTVRVDQTEAEKYAPEARPIEVKIGESPKAEDGISNKSDLPADSKYTWKSPVDTTTSGDKLGTVIVTYSDGTKDEVVTTVRVDQTEAETYAPEVQMIEVKIGESPKAENGINNKSVLPAGSKYAWKNSVDTTTSGDKVGTIVVTYPDGSQDKVEVKVIVDKPQTDANKTISKDRDAHTIENQSHHDQSIKKPESKLESSTAKATERKVEDTNVSIIKVSKTTKKKAESKRELPQTGAKSEEAVGMLGLAIMTVGSLLGLTGSRKKRER